MIRPFDPSAPLRPGVTVLEASAGTGKTHAITGLVVRCVAAGSRLPRVLVVTFTRLATAELRDRVRRRLVAAAAHAGAVLGGAHREVGGEDAVLAWLVDCDEVELRRRHVRLDAALAEFDAATIATIHGFCQQVLAGIGLAADVDPGAEFLDRPAELLDGLVDDLMVRRFSTPAPVAGADPCRSWGSRSDGHGMLRREDVARIAKAVTANPDAAIVAGGDDPVARLRCAVAREIREQVDRHKRSAALLSYDDLLTRLAVTLRDPVRGAAARRRLQARFDVALVDEFQDTDPVQWEIVSTVFGRDGKSLVLIGDPKQAIYAFRGADVHAYLAARRRAGQQLETLDRNWRSDGPLLDACNVLFRGATMGDADIAYADVTAAPSHAGWRLRGAPVAAPLRLRVLRRDSGVRLTPKGYVQADAARDHIARDVAAQVVALLSAGAEIIDAAARSRSVSPPDVAVLVRTNDQAAQVQRALRDAAVPGVINGVGSVFATPSAGDWLRLLEALERPADRGRARVAAVTALVGWTGSDVAAATDHDWERLHQQLRGWADLLRAGNVAAVQRAVAVAHRLPERLLAQPDGERRLVDLEHVGELLHAAAVADGLGVGALTVWLRAQMADPGDDAAPDERSRRLESDAAAVQVLTVHRSKGLEFPIVFAPFMWSRWDESPAVPVVHDATAGARVVDVAGGGAACQERRDQALEEARWEELRLLYVALTRARHQVVVWWAPGAACANAPLSRVLLCRRSNGTVLNAPNVNPRGMTDETIAARLAALAADSGGTITVEDAPVHATLPRWAPPAAPAAELAAARFDRDVDRRWRRTSYTGLVAAAAAPVVAGEPDEPVTADEQPLATATEAAGEATDSRAVALPLADLPGGALTGTLVHAVLEAVDFAAPDVRGAVEAELDRQAARRHVAVGDRAAVADGLCAALRTPLGPLLGELRLADVPRRDRLDELSFELPLALGDGDGDGDVDVAAIGALLEQHLPPDDPLADYPAQLRDAAFRHAVRGYLTGSIDCVLRLPDGRFAVVDYKTNRLAPPGAVLTAWHYRHAALVAAMRRGHYPLQALLYLAALHRYLRWRLRGYDPDTHLAGVAYCFLRGMVGAAAPRDAGQPAGVYTWRPPTDLVQALSDLFAHGRAQ